ncbi:MAG: FGGY family carbohydrate kinase [Thermomicrobiales bacterium]
MEHRGLIGIDLGTSSVKVVIFDRTDGRLLGASSASYPIDRPQPGHAEQAPERWWQATIDAVRRALANAEHPPIDAIGLSGQMHGTVLLDRAFGSLRRPSSGPTSARHHKRPRSNGALAPT